MKYWIKTEKGWSIADISVDWWEHNDIVKCSSFPHHHIVYYPWWRRLLKLKPILKKYEK
jgi:hypothetical protein